TGKTKFVALDVPGSVDWASIHLEGDDQVADHAVGIINDHQPQVMFVHFPDDDNVGHAIGWGSPQQIATLGKADRALGKVLDAIEANGLTDSTLIILTADHG